MDATILMWREEEEEEEEELDSREEENWKEEKFRELFHFEECVRVLVSSFVTSLLTSSNKIVKVSCTIIVLSLLFSAETVFYNSVCANIVLQ